MLLNLEKGKIHNYIDYNKNIIILSPVITLKYIGVINSGSFGTVLKYYNNITNNYYAVKEIKGDDMDIIEIELNISLNIFNCKNLINQYPLYSKGKYLFLMEYCHGSIYDNTWLSGINIYKVLNVLIEEMICILSQGYIYMDLKPEQVLYKGDRYIIGDIGSIGKLNSTFKNGNYIYNKLYSPPELNNINIYINKKSGENINVYQLGLMLLDYFTNMNEETLSISKNRGSIILYNILDNVNNPHKIILSSMLNVNPTKRPKLKTILKIL